MDNKSGSPVDLRSAPPIQESPQVVGNRPPVEQGTGSETPYLAKGTGYEGPGMGNLKKLNSDDAPVGPTYPT